MADLSASEPTEGNNIPVQPTATSSEGGGATEAAEPEIFNEKETVEVQCVDATDTSLTLAWNSLDSVLKWELEWRLSQGGEWAPLGSKGFKTAMPPKQKNGLTPDTSFDFRVRGRDAVSDFNNQIRILSFSTPLTYACVYVLFLPIFVFTLTLAPPRYLLFLSTWGL
jgi:hypothetical protein